MGIDRYSNSRYRINANHGIIVGSSPAMLQLYRDINLLASAPATVLVHGETGTGKELVAKALHYNGGRDGKPFCVLNCGAIPSELLESWLFGHKKGAFTGAITEEPGMIYSANGGTLLLDEIGDMSPVLQTKLLRVLQEKEVTQVGASQPRKVDVRFVAATHKNLDELVHEGKFREDLLYRLTTAHTCVPSLRERAEDVPALVEYFTEQLEKEYRKSITVGGRAIDYLMSQPWRGNVRELRSAIEQVFIRKQKGEATPADFLHRRVLFSVPVSSNEMFDLSKIVAEHINTIRNELAVGTGGAVNERAVREIVRAELDEKYVDLQRIVRLFLDEGLERTEQKVQESLQALKSEVENAGSKHINRHRELISKERDPVIDRLAARSGAKSVRGHSPAKKLVTDSTYHAKHISADAYTQADQASNHIQETAYNTQAPAVIQGKRWFEDGVLPLTIPQILRYEGTKEKITISRIIAKSKDLFTEGFTGERIFRIVYITPRTAERFFANPNGGLTRMLSDMQEHPLQHTILQPWKAYTIAKLAEEPEILTSRVRLTAQLKKAQTLMLTQKGMREIYVVTEDTLPFLTSNRRRTPVEALAQRIRRHHEDLLQWKPSAE